MEEGTWGSTLRLQWYITARPTNRSISSAYIAYSGECQAAASTNHCRELSLDAEKLSPLCAKCIRTNLNIYQTRAKNSSICAVEASLSPQYIYVVDSPENFYLWWADDSPADGMCPRLGWGVLWCQYGIKHGLIESLGSNLYYQCQSRLSERNWWKKLSCDITRWSLMRLLTDDHILFL